MEHFLAGMMGILFFVIIFGGSLFVCFGLPIWAIIHCVSSNERGSASKVIWTLVIVFTWTFGAILYGLFGSSKGGLRWASVITVGFGILLVIGLVFLMNWCSAALSAQVNQSMARLKTVDTTELKPEELQDIQNKLSVLSKETRISFKNIDQVSTSHELMKSFISITGDNKIEAQEYRSWSKEFEIKRILPG